MTDFDGAVLVMLALLPVVLAIASLAWKEPGAVLFLAAFVIVWLFILGGT